MDPNTHDTGSKAPLHLVRDADSARLLLDAGGSYRARDREANTPLHYACMRSNEAITALLIEHGAKYGHEVENR
jgi:ankyrin repeat protein